MAFAIDTNILVALWGGSEEEQEAAGNALTRASSFGSLTICGAVYSELLADPRRTRASIAAFCKDSEISIDWDMTEAIWDRAGEAFQIYAKRRKRQGSGLPRRILTDFVIGAHASVNGHSLLTLDSRIFRSTFPELKIIST